MLLQQPEPAVRSLGDHHHTYRKLAAAFVADGFAPGRPPQLDNVSFWIDQKTAKAMVCPGCMRTGLVATPWRNGNRYRVLAACPHCDAAEEV